MKKLVIIILSVILLIVVIAIGIQYVFFRHTPERLFKWTFKINLKNFDYNVDTFEEQWCPNGDGHALVIIKFNHLTQENINYLKGLNLKSLPVSKEDCNFMRFRMRKVIEEYFESDFGYYIYEPLSSHDIRDFQVLIIDTEMKTAVLYYQYM